MANTRNYLSNPEEPCPHCGGTGSFIISDGKAIRRKRRELELTLEEVSKQAGISPSYLSDIEHNRRNAPLLTLDRIVEALEAFEEAIPA